MAQHYPQMLATGPAGQFVFGDTAGDLLILTGRSGTGKSSLCALLANRARDAGLSTGGLISPPVFSNGRKIAIDLIDQLSGESRRLAARRTTGAPGLTTDHWSFDPTALAWGNQCLLDLPPCDLFFLDELGPLEFRRGEGLLAGLALLDRRRGGRSVVVIRPELLTEASARWPWGRVVDLGVGNMNYHD